MIESKLDAELQILKTLVKSWNYESLLDFFLCIDKDSGINPLEHTQKVLRDFHKNNSKLFIIRKFNS